ncbi:RsiV family protein [Acinetobacter sp. MB5]|uniref:RsiV family protein n=1 Tax=Acinetobacter sp. MB5 TaxID=2069438 RepID=UPI000DCFFF8A|nr:RsiV family protein [Acinetobacter sp. MB5]
MLRKNLSMTFSMSVLSVSLLLSACQKQNDDTEKTVSAAQMTQAKAIQNPYEFTANLENIPVQLPACEGNNCPEFQVQRLNTNYDFIDTQVDAAILAALRNNLDLAAINPAASEVFASEPEPSDLNHQVQQYAKAFLILDQQLKSMNANPQITFHVQPKILRKQDNIVTVQLNSDSFLGGAHGTEAQQYLVFDLKQKQQLKLGDVLLPNQKDQLLKQLHQQFQDWVIEQKLANNVQEYEDAWPFKLTSNFYFSAQGLVLQYAEYEIGPYVVGMPTFTIPYEKLKGIVKSEYLPKPDTVAATTASVVKGTA